MATPQAPSQQTSPSSGAGGVEKAPPETQQQRLWRFLQSVLPHDYYEKKVKKFNQITLEGMLLNSRILGVVDDVNVLNPKSASDMQKFEEVRRRVLLESPILQMLQSIEEETQRERRQREKDPSSGADEGSVPCQELLPGGGYNSSSLWGESPQDILEGLRRGTGQAILIGTGGVGKRAPSGPPAPGGPHVPSLRPPLLPDPRIEPNAAVISKGMPVHTTGFTHCRKDDVSLRDYFIAHPRAKTRLGAKRLPVVSDHGQIATPHSSKELLELCRRSHLSTPLPQLKLMPVYRERPGVMKNSTLQFTKIPTFFHQQSAEQRIASVLPYTSKPLRPPTRQLAIQQVVATTTDVL